LQWLLETFRDRIAESRVDVFLEYGPTHDYSTRQVPMYGQILETLSAYSWY